MLWGPTNQQSTNDYYEKYLPLLVMSPLMECSMQSGHFWNHTHVHNKYTLRELYLYICACTYMYYDTIVIKIGHQLENLEKEEVLGYINWKEL